MSDERAKRIEKRLMKIINDIPGDDGEWNKTGDEKLMDLGREMLRLGAGLTEIEYHFTRIYWAIVSEFGG